MLNSVMMKGFKSYFDAEMRLAPLTLLIGANASGKSNAIEALRLLNWLAQGQKLFAIRNKIRDEDELFRGIVENIGYCGADHFTLGCRIEEEWGVLVITFRSVDGELHIVDEWVSKEDGGKQLYKIERPALPPSSDVVVSYNNFTKGTNPQIICSDQMAIFTQLDRPAAFVRTHAKSQEVIPRVSKVFQDILGGVLFLDPVPSMMRSSEFKTEKKLRGDGRNLSGVLFNLCADGDNKEVVLGLIKSLPEQDVANISFYESDKGKVMVELEESFAQQCKKWDATLLSDGTLRVLAIAAALLTAQEGSLVVIEEVDNGVHPSRAGHLLSGMLSVANKRNLRLLLSTHNPALMDAVPDSALGDVVFCYRDVDDGSSRLVALREMDDFAVLAAGGSLGQLVTSKIVDRFAKNQIGVSAKRQRDLDWLTSVEKMMS